MRDVWWLVTSLDQEAKYYVNLLIAVNAIKKDFVEGKAFDPVLGFLLIKVR